jgi:hypothetical protein
MQRSNGSMQSAMPYVSSPACASTQRSMNLPPYASLAVRHEVQ